MKKLTTLTLLLVISSWTFANDEKERIDACTEALMSVPSFAEAIAQGIPKDRFVIRSMCENSYDFKQLTVNNFKCAAPRIARGEHHKIALLSCSRSY